MLALRVLLEGTLVNLPFPIFAAVDSASTSEADLNWDAFKSEEVKNSCQWIADQYSELPRQNSIAESIKGSFRRRRKSEAES